MSEGSSFPAGFGAGLSREERACDGPLHPDVGAILRAGSPRRAALQRAGAETRFFRDRVRQQIGLMRLCRTRGAVRPHLAADLAAYLRQYRAWRQQERLLAALVRAEALGAAGAGRVAGGGGRADELLRRLAGA